MELLKFKFKVFEYYKENVTGNNEVDYLEARKKMTRNMLLAYKEDSSEHSAQLYKYGSLWFLVDNNKIVWMRNRCSIPQDWTLDKQRYVELSKELGIGEYENVAELHIKQTKGKLKYWKNKLRYKVSGVFQKSTT